MWFFKSKNNLSSSNNDEISQISTEKKFHKSSIEELKSLEDNEIYEYLRKAWEIEENSPIKVWGYVSFNNSFCGLYRVKNFKNNKPLEYPISNLEKENISDRGVFLEYSSTESSYNNKYISCNLILSSEKERDKKNNPLLLQVDKKSIEICIHIPLIETIENEEGSILIEESIIKHIKEVQEDKINKSLENLNIAKKQIESEVSQLYKTKDEEKQYILSIKNKQKNLLQEINQQEEKQKNFKKDIQQLHIQIEKDKKMREENLKKIRDFVKSKAKLLLELDLIEEFEYNKIIGKDPKEKAKDRKFLDFNKDFKGDYSKAISHIQAYLFKQNTVYYRYLLEDYFTSIKTNDLIILAGDSGSGKTNLVKKFAEAVGGVAKIIPVKPNWTSSDDLLGYYNPLQKSYLSTLFLDALIEASENPSIPYFICLDEMNLARVEYYFADFLSLLEERDKEPQLNLYSDAESVHTISEFNHALTLIGEIKKNSDKKIVTFIDILKDKKLNEELKKVFGFGDKDSLIKYHSDLRRMISGVLNIPSSITFPKNVRIIGTINIDETTHYLSPKILDRAHVIKLNSPSLSDWGTIEKEVIKLDISNVESKINFKIEDFGLREPYPQYNPKDDFCKKISELSEKYLSKLSIEVSLRAVRQGLKYNQIFAQFNSNSDIAFNNFLLHKILPKFTFDSNAKVDGKDKIEIIKSLKADLKTINSESQILIVQDELGKIIKKSQENDGLVNYWT